jgi:hypothetical protein
MLSRFGGRNRRTIASSGLAIRARGRWFESNRLLDLGGGGPLLDGRSRWKSNTLGATHRRSFSRFARCRRRVRNLDLLHGAWRYEARVTLKECKEGVGRLFPFKECSHAKKKKIVLLGLKAWFEQKLSTAAVLQKRLSGAVWQEDFGR